MTVLDPTDTQVPALNPAGSATERPRPRIELNPDGIPDQARREKRWVVWIYKWVDERWTKVPICAASGRNASSTDPSTWTTFDHALEVYRKHSNRYAGIGFMLGDGWAGADFDHCIGSDGVVAAWATELVNTLGSYTEGSPGGEGLKTLMRGIKPGIRCKQKDYGGPGTAVELYDHDRFFTFTGQHLEGTPTTVEDRTEQLTTAYHKVFPPKPKQQRNATSSPGPGFEGSDDELLQVAIKSRQSDKLRRLLSGDTSAYGDDHSSADLALCNILAFWTGRDADRIDQIFRTSGLYREKWDREDYRQRTIEKAIESCAEVYTPTRKTQGSGSAAVPQPPSVKGPLSIRLVVVDVHQTPSRQNIRFAVHIGGQDTQVKLAASETPGSIRAAAKVLAETYADTQPQPLTAEQLRELTCWLRKILTSTSICKLGEQLQAAKPVPKEAATPTGPSMFDIALRHMRDELQLAFVDSDGGVWSERFGRVFDRNEFTSWLPPELLSQIAAAAHDYPEPTPMDPTKPIRHLQLTLRPVWTSLAATLPEERQATELGPDSKAATAFRQSLCRLWLVPETWMKFDPGQNELGRIERMSLASRVRELIHVAKQQPPRWDRVLKGVNAFYRVEKDTQGQAVVWLAMRVDLCHGEIKGASIDSVVTQEDLTVLMTRYGLSNTSKVTDRLREEGRQQRICVLSRALCDYLVACEDPEPEGACHTHAGGAVTGGLDGMKINTTTGEVLEMRQVK